MTEFDTSATFRKEKTFTLVSGKARDEIASALMEEDFWRPTGARQAGDGGNGEVWLDYSDAFRTRYLKVNVDEAAENSGSFTVTVSSACSMSRLGEVVFCALVLLMIWGLSKAFMLRDDRTLWFALTIFSFISSISLLFACLTRSPWSVPASDRLADAMTSKFNKR